MKKLFENWRKHLNEAEYEPDPRLTRGLERSMGPSDPEPEPNESNVDVNSRIGEHFTKWFAAYSRGPTGGRGRPIHRDKAPAAAKSLATDLRAGKFLSSVPEELKEQYTQLFNNLADALEQNPLLAHFRKLGKRGNWYAIATGNWDESMYNPPPYSDPNARRDYGWEN